jgi:hypothetical protein
MIGRVVFDKCIKRDGTGVELTSIGKELPVLYRQNIPFLSIPVSFAS